MNASAAASINSILSDLTFSSRRSVVGSWLIHRLISANSASNS